jgi:hypothetical protein
MIRHLQDSCMSMAVLKCIAGILLGASMGIPQGANAYVERIGMIESTDHGATWTFRGHADFHTSLLNPVDPSALVVNGLSVFYFFDLQSLGTDTAVVYRSVATDAGGLDFTSPAVAFKYAGDLTDPFVVRLASGKYRMYVHTPSAILSATSSDGFAFTLDDGERTRAGGVPGALVLKDDSVRLFVCGGGIMSLQSQNGLDFAPESGVRIQTPFTGKLAADPSPIKCIDGKYRMAYKIRPSGVSGPEVDEVHLAVSPDGLHWTPGAGSIAIGSVPTMIELPDGRLRIYYVDFQSDQPAPLFRLLNRTPVTPDSSFLTAGFVRIGYIPAKDRLAVTFGGLRHLPTGDSVQGHSFKEYTPDMGETGISGSLSDDTGDCSGLLVGNTYYDVTMAHHADTVGWRIMKFDATTWEKQTEILFRLDRPREHDGDMMIAFVNGQLDISSDYDLFEPQPPDTGDATHHEFFDTDLHFQGKRILSDVRHITGSSMIFAGNVYHFVTGTAYTGDVIVMKYDSDWHFLGWKKIRDQAHWAEGISFDGKRFYLAYLSTSQRANPGFFPYYPNVHLAAFDLDWNLLADVPVTNFGPEDSLFTGRPSMLQHGGKLFVTYDVVPLPEDLNKIEGFVSAYEIASPPSAVPALLTSHPGYLLEQNFPNPFNPTTRICYAVARVVALSGSEGPATKLRLVVYDLLGREVKVLLDEQKAPGKYQVEFDGAKLSSGVYIYRLTAGNYVESKRMMLMK